MSWLNRIGRRLEPFAIPHLALVLVAGQMLMLVAIRFLQIIPVEACLLRPALVLQGEWWRLVTFAFMPPFFPETMLGIVWVAFALYVFYLFASALENHWGALRFNLFLLCGYLLTVGVAFIVPGAVASNVFIGGSVFLAFAYLNPEFEIMLFFILPVRIKWLALVAWLGYAWTFFTGGLATKLVVAAAVGNFLVFFAPDLLRRARAGKRRMETQAARVAREGDTPAARNRCHVCGKTSRTHPLEDFRYCSKCEGDYCYCSEHIRTHEHVVPPGARGETPASPNNTRA